MSFCKLCFALLLVFPCSDLVSGQTKNAADEFRECYLRDKTKGSECMFQFWKTTIPLMKNAIPEMDVPQLDPLHIDRIDWNEKAPAMSVTAQMTNMKIYGASDAIITAAAIIPSTRTTTYNMTLPTTYITSDFVVNGTVMVLPINGKGQMHLNVTGMTAVGRGLVEQQGTGIRMVKLDLDLAIKGLFVKFTQASNDPVWDAVGSMMNENYQLLFDDIKPVVASRMADTLLKISAGALLKMPPEAFIA